MSRMDAMDTMDSMDDMDGIQDGHRRFFRPVGADFSYQLNSKQLSVGEDTFVPSGLMEFFLV